MAPRETPLDEEDSALIRVRFPKLAYTLKYVFLFTKQGSDDFTDSEDEDVAANLADAALQAQLEEDIENAIQELKNQNAQLE